MNSTSLLLAALLGAIVAPAFAADAEAGAVQQTTVITHGSPYPHSPESGMPLFSPAMRAHAKPVKNAPYSAEVVFERQQNLADGNQIASKTTSPSYRDSAGRTRQEMRDAKGEVLTVTIHDPVEAATYVLNPRTRTATKITVDKQLGKVAAEAARARVEQLRKEGKLPTTERREIIIRQFEGSEGELKMNITDGVAARVEGAQMSATPNGRELAVRLGPLAGAMADMKWASKATTKDLGTRDIEGVKAEGKLRSYEIPAGEVGNRYPITVSDETWHSPELNVTVLSKHSDPRSGENIYRLAGIRRDEPAAALFTVPSDYTIKDVMANVTRMLDKKTP